MKKINLVGPIDKRLIAYPMLKVMDLVGKVLVVTDDANFRRFAEEYESEFSLGKSDFLIVSEVTSNTLVEFNYNVNSYDFVVYITTKTLIPDSDKIVYCHGMNKSILTPDVLEDLEDIEYDDVLISQAKVKSKDVINIDVNKVTMGYIWDCEENKDFESCKVVELIKVSSHLFSDIVGVSKEEYSKIIGRKEE